jgi:peptide/nickel transport system substrate-binding protein
LTRRSFLVASGMGLAALSLAGCDSGSDGEQTGTTETASIGPTPSALQALPGPPAGDGVPGGRTVVGFLSEGNSWDPALGYTETSWDSICNLTFSPLYSYGVDEEPLPNAAAAMPEVSADGLVYTIPLKEGVTFHNGRAVTAADYKYAWERVLDPKLQSWASSYITTIAGAKERLAGKTTTVSGIRVVDDLTLGVTLTQPDVTFLFALTQPFMAPVPREEVERLGNEWGVSAVVGNGPFELVSYEPAQQKAEFVKHAGHYWQGLPYVDEVGFEWGLDATVQLLKLQRGEVNVLYSGFTPEQLVRVATSSKLKDFLYTHPLYASRWVNLNPSVGAFRNRDVREALNWATDRDQLSRITKQEGTPFGAPFPETFLAGARTFTPFTYDPDRARELLADVDPADLRATLYVTESPEPQLGQLLQQQWKVVGFDLQLKQIGLDASYDLALKGKLDAWFSTYYAVYPTAIDLVSQYYETGGGSNYTKYSNAEVDRLTNEARSLVDVTERDGRLAEVEQILGDDAVHVYLQTVNWLMGVDRERLQNFAYSGVYGAYYDRLWVES